MGRRTFSREYKLEAVRLVRDRGVSVAQAAPTSFVGLQFALAKGGPSTHERGDRG